MKRFILSFSVITIVIGTFMFAAFIIGGQNATYLIKQETIYGITLYRIDIKQYLYDLQTTINTLPKDIYTAPPQFPTIKFTDNPFENITQVGKAVVNSMIYNVNMLTWLGTSLLIAPFKLLAYLINIILLVLGINPNNYQIGLFFQTIYNLTIDQINYL